MRVRWRVIWPPDLSSRSSPMRRPSEAQFVVFSLKSFVQDLVGSRIKVFHMAIIAGANQDRGPAVDVSFVAPLPKCHFFHALCHAPLFADFTKALAFFGPGHPWWRHPRPWMLRSSPETILGVASMFARGRY